MKLLRILRPAVPALLAMLAVLAVAGCGGTDVVGVGASLTSAPRETGGADAPGSETPEIPQLPEDLQDVLPEGAVPEDLPDPGAVDDCFDVAAAYAGLALSVIGGPEAAAEARRVADELKSQLPEDLHDDLDVIADAYAGLAEEGILDGAGALDDPEFAEANQNIQTYLEETCAGG